MMALTMRYVQSEPWILISSSGNYLDLVRNWSPPLGGDRNNKVFLSRDRRALKIQFLVIWDDG